MEIGRGGGSGALTLAYRNAIFGFVALGLESSRRSRCHIGYG